MTAESQPSPRAEGRNPYVLGIEGGATHSTWALLRVEAHRTETLVAGEAGPGNLHLLADSEIRSLFLGILQDAEAALGDRIHFAGACFAGAAQCDQRIRVQNIVDDLRSDLLLRIGADAEAALAGAFGTTGNGIVVIAGTGSAVLGRNKGTLRSAGGYGHLFSDHGSAYDLAAAALERAFLDYDRSGHTTSTPLAQALLEATGQNEMQGLVSWTLANNRKQTLAFLARSVVALAETGDRAALDVLRSRGKQLALSVQACAAALQWAAPRVAVKGGLFENSALWFDIFRRELQAVLPGVVSMEVTRVPGAIASASLALEDARQSGLASSAMELHGDEQLRPLDPNTLAEETLIELETEQPNPRSAGLSEKSSREFIELCLNEEAFVAEALRANHDAIAEVCELVGERLAQGNRLFYVGAGTSGRLGVLDATEIPPTFNAPPDLVQGIIAGGINSMIHSSEELEDDASAAQRTLRDRGVVPGDVVIGIAASGRTPFVIGALNEARKRRAHTVLISCNPETPTRELAEKSILLRTGPEIVAGSTRMKAGTATKLVLNMISTYAMIRLGRVEDNLMVAVKATNAKLRRRAVYLLHQLKDIDEKLATRILIDNNWDVRSALQAMKHAEEVENELFDVVNEQDEVIDRKPRGVVHAEGLNHRAIHVFFFNQDGHVFLQRRSLLKKNHPDTWDSSCSGHVDAGESYDQAAPREVAEELGVKGLTVGPHGLEPAFKIDACAETGREFVWLYCCHHEGPFQLNPAEISGGRWFAPEDLDRTLENDGGNFAPAFAYIWKRFRAQEAEWAEIEETRASDEIEGDQEAES